MRTALFALMALISASAAQGQIAWRGDLKIAYDEANASGQPLLLHFESSECPWCDKLEKTVLSDPRVTSVINNQYIPVSIDGRLHPRLLVKFDITRYPTEVVVSADGTILSHQVNPQSAEDYLAMLGQRPPQFAVQPQFAEQPQFAANAQGAEQPQFPPTPAETAGHRIPAVQPPMSAPLGAERTLPEPPLTVSIPTGHPAAGPRLSGPPISGPSADVRALPPVTAQPIAVADAAARPEPAGFTAPSGTSPGPKPTAKPQPTPDQPQQPIIDGFCLVTLREQEKWVQADPRFGAVHLGQLYLFASAEAQRKFLTKPDFYAPALNGIDVVKFFDDRQVVQGSPEWGYTDSVSNRMFFFSSEDTMNHFFDNFERYTGPALGLMERAAAESNSWR